MVLVGSDGNALFTGTSLASGGLQVSAASKRNAGVLHRSAITSFDKCAVPAAPTLAAVTEAGSTLPNSALNVAVAAFITGYGSTGAGPTTAITPSLNQAVRTTIAQIAGATHYDVFISTVAAPLWVGRITEAQRAAGGFIISTVGTVTAGGGAAAGQVDLGIVGTGLASNVAPFTVNNAYNVAAITQIVCTGYTVAYLYAQLTVTDLRSLPVLQLIPFFVNQIDTNLYQGATLALGTFSSTGQALRQVFAITLNGSTGLAIAIDSIAGQGAAASIWVELA
jgi:hypothetical protein